MRSLGKIAVVLLIVAVAGCSVRSQPEPYAHGTYGSSPSNPMAEGEVTRIDAPERVIVLSNGQMYQVPADSVVYVNGQPVAWTTVQPGSRVAIGNGQLVELRDGRYVVAPAGAVTTAPAGVRQTIYGRVTDVDRNEIRVKIADESFEVKMKDPKGAGIRKGDNVQIDMTFSPTSPSAMPKR